MRAQRACASLQSSLKNKDLADFAESPAVHWQKCGGKPTILQVLLAGWVRTLVLAVARVQGKAGEFCRVGA